MDSGNTPYNISVKNAPSSVPTGLIASAAVISNTTNIQPMATRYIFVLP